MNLVNVNKLPSFAVFIHLHMICDKLEKCKLNGVNAWKSL